MKDNVYEDAIDHSRRVAILSRKLSKHMGHPDKYNDKVFITGCLHDIGKFKVQDSILGKEGSLTVTEFKRVKLHPIHSYEMAIMLGIKDKDILEGILYHHEAYSGKGYPEGRKGTDINLISRMLTICDVFDALMSARSYKSKYSIESTILKMREMHEEGKFDKMILESFFQMIGDSNDVANIYNVSYNNTSRSGRVLDMGLQSRKTL